MNAIIVDDEKHCRESLFAMLKLYCPEVVVSAICGDGPSAVEAITVHKPDAVFLDVEMPRMNGFDLLQCFSQIDFNVIFTTAYDKYALKAIKFSAVDYLLKPIDCDELVQAVRKLKERQGPYINREQLQSLMHNTASNNQVDFKLIIATSESNYFLQTDEILYCEGINNYTHFHLTKNRKLVSAKTLKEYDELLTDHSFLRIHKSYLVNIKYVDRFVKNESLLILADHTILEVSRRKKEAVVNALFHR